MEVFSEEELVQEARGKTQAWKVELWAVEVSHYTGRETILSQKQGGISTLKHWCSCCFCRQDPYVHKIFL